jgi:hypothetical protein
LTTPPTSRGQGSSQADKPPREGKAPAEPTNPSGGQGSRRAEKPLGNARLQPSRKTPREGEAPAEPQPPSGGRGSPQAANPSGGRGSRRADKPTREGEAPTKPTNPLARARLPPSRKTPREGEAPPKPHIHQPDKPVGSAGASTSQRDETQQKNRQRKAPQAAHSPTGQAGRLSRSFALPKEEKPEAGDPVFGVVSVLPRTLTGHHRRAAHMR